MASCIQWTCTTLKGTCGHQGGSRSAQMERGGLGEPQQEEQDAPLFSDGNECQVARGCLQVRRQDSKMKLSLQNLGATVCVECNSPGGYPEELEYIVPQRERAAVMLGVI